MKSFLIPFLLLCSLFILPSSWAAQRPNIIVLLIDDMGYECIGANGCTSYQTPVIDKLAAAGVRFEHGYAQPVCTPTRVQVMTGIYNVRTDILPTICEAAGVTVPAALKIDGHSFLPQVRGESGQPREWFYSWIAPLKDQGIIAEFASTQEFKLSRTGDFYDLRNDREEKQPLKVVDLKDEAALAAARLLQAPLDRYKNARPAELAMPFLGPKKRGDGRGGKGKKKDVDL